MKLANNWIAVAALSFMLLAPGGLAAQEFFAGKTVWIVVGVPEDRVALLRKAFMDTLKDPGLLAEAKKARIDVDPIDGIATTKMFGELYDLSPQLVNELKTILSPHY